MSKLIEELQKVDKTSSQPIGFITSRQATAGPRLRLIAAAVPGENIPAELVDGADAALLIPGKTRPSVTSIKKSVEMFRGIPWGIYLKDTNSGTISSLTQEECDFVIFPAASQVSAIPSDDNTGRIIEVEPSFDDGLIRAINRLPVDAVILRDSFDEEGPLVWHKLMTIQHLINLITKPFIIGVTPEAVESDIKALWEAGADGVIAKINAGKPDGIKKLRDLIDRLPARKLPKKGSSEALLPYPREAKTAEPEPEVEEEDRE